MSAHVVPIRSHLAVFAALLTLTGATVAAAFVDLGPLSTVIAFTIAGAKAALVALCFMHLRTTGRMTWVFAAAGIGWFLLLLVLVLADVDTRDWLPILSR